MVPVFTEFHKFEVVFVIGLASTAMDNFLITGLLVRSLVCFSRSMGMPYFNMLQREHKTGFMDTDNIIKKIIRGILPPVRSQDASLSGTCAFLVTLQTGLLAAIWTLIDLAIYIALVS